MKVLMITNYVTLEGTAHREFNRIKTGFGYMVYDIVRAVGKREDVDVLAIWSRGEAFNIEGVHFLKRSFVLFFRFFYRSVGIRLLVQILGKYTETRGARIRLLYSWLLTGYLDKVLEDGHYDIVHIHGCSPATELWMDVCRRRGVRFVVTLHGLNSFSEAVHLDAGYKQYERDFLRRVVAGEIHVTVISTGIKRIIERSYGAQEGQSVSVVGNSFSFNESRMKSNDQVNIRAKYGIGDNSKLIVCVGNISPRKNQGQLVSAFNHLPMDLAVNTYILFLGGITNGDYTIEKIAERSHWREHFITCGQIPKERVSSYYEQCNGVALMSLSEGFGLSLIEGFHFGKPCMSFSDIDAFSDIYSQEVMIGVYEHGDEAVAEGMVKLLTTDWQEERIKEYSKRFESDEMAKHYIEVYRGELKTIHSS